MTSQKTIYEFWERRLKEAYLGYSIDKNERTAEVFFNAMKRAEYDDLYNLVKVYADKYTKENRDDRA